MKNTGVIRRIDDLGRIVIPKEIRKNLRIKEGECLEVFVTGGDIVLKKYSEMLGNKELFKKFVDSFYSELRENILITDRDKVLACAGDLRLDYCDKAISMKLDDIINKRLVVSSFSFKNFPIVDEKSIKISYIIVPMIVKSEAIGALVVFSSNKELNESIVRIASIGAKILEKYVE